MYGVTELVDIVAGIPVTDMFAAETVVEDVPRGAGAVATRERTESKRNDEK